MKIIRTSRGLKILSPAKINLFLEVIGKRPDGFHELESVMQCVSLYDILYFKPARKDITVSTDCPELDDSKNNLVYRPPNCSKNNMGQSRGANIPEKKYSIGGGMGGGSSNAAAT